ncbi:MAG: hypothetical protein FVQ81_02060 [Candidatus Glassbacteria bacterium]|nr:hypothetical protein [Candidatus Glassbacteria bacterium]
MLKRSREGIYSPTARRAILNVAGRASADTAQSSRAKIRGGLVRGGQIGSISSQRLLAQPGLQRQKTMADQGDRLTTTNELSKVQAGEDFASLQDRLDSGRRESRRQGLGSLLEGGLNAVGAGVETYLQEDALEDLTDFNRRYSQIDLLIQAGKYDEAQRMMEELFGAGGGLSVSGGLRSRVPAVQDRVHQHGGS